MSLHDLAEPIAALTKAVDLLCDGGSIIISHPKGAEHVEMQNRRAPDLVPNLLPSFEDLEVFCGQGDSESERSLELECFEGDGAAGYLAVITCCRGGGEGDMGEVNQEQEEPTGLER